VSPSTRLLECVPACMDATTGRGSMGLPWDYAGRFLKCRPLEGLCQEYHRSRRQAGPSGPGPTPWGLAGRPSGATGRDAMLQLKHTNVHPREWGGA
jgi:hypothetical protein